MAHLIRSRPFQLALLGALALGLLAVVAARLVPAAAAAPTELFFSEEVEGSSNNKALEIYNGTGAPVTLTDSYDVQIFANGSPTATATIPLTGTVASGDVFVLARSTAVAAILAVADQTTTNFLYNGNDAIALRSDGAIVDVIGQIGTDPGTSWGSGDTSTVDATLRRKATVQAGDPDGTDAFDPAVEWDGFPIDTFSGLGSHSVTPGGGGGGGGGGTGGGENGVPVASPDTAALDEDSGPLTIDVLGNDSDPDGDALTVTAAEDGQFGSVEVVDGSLTYDPDVDFNGADSFTYTISDGRGGSATGTVAVTVAPIDDDPDLEDDEATTPAGQAVTIDVLANDEDVDGDTLAVEAAEGAEHGSTSVAAAGLAVVYTPAPGFTGTDSFEYAAVDGAGGGDSAEVIVTVAGGAPPIARDDRATVKQGQSVVVDVLANDSPGSPGSPVLTVSSVSPAAHGNAELLTSGPDAGTVRYTPAAAYRGPDSFTYVVSDGTQTAGATVSVTVRPVSFGTLCRLEPTIFGTLHDDVIQGTPGDDVIRARRGNDRIDGAGGDDVICGGAGADEITAGDGDDWIATGSGNDTLTSGGGADHARGGFGRDSITTGDGPDRVAAGPGDDTVDGGDANDVLSAGAGDDQVTAGAGNDRVNGGPGTDTCDAGTGHNRVSGCE